MSTGLNCDFFEPEKDKWYYVLQDWSCPVGAFDWREHATCYGPFHSEDDAIRHLSDNHANPGGWGTTPFEDFKTSPVWEKLQAEAKKPDTFHNTRTRWR